MALSWADLSPAAFAPAAQASVPAPIKTTRASVERRMGRLSELQTVFATQSAVAQRRRRAAGARAPPGRRRSRGRWRPTEELRSGREFAAKKKPAHAPAFSFRREGGHVSSGGC